MKKWVDLSVEEKLTRLSYAIEILQKRVEVVAPPKEIPGYEVLNITYSDEGYWA